MANLLFVCSKNKWRSPTAESFFKNHPQHQARSAGTSSEARIKLNQKMIDRADVIYVMERKHRDLIKERFTFAGKKLIVLNIPDEYRFNDPELIEIFKVALFEYLNTDSV